MIPQKIIEELIGVVGERFVLYAPEDLIVFEYDGSQATGYPEVVVVPGSAEEVAQTVKIAHREGIPVVPRGAGTSISGGALASTGGILLPLTRLKKVLEVDTENLLAVVEPGLVNVDLSAAVSQFGLYYAPDPSSQKACTIGGNVSENAGGPHCLSYGVTTNHVLGLEVVLHNGDMMWVGGKVRDVPGYDLTGAIVGSEGTFVVVTKVIVRLMPKPESVKTLLAVYDDPIDATNTVSAVIGAGIIPAALEMIDNVVIRAVEKVIKAGFPMDAGAVLLIEVEGLEESAREEAAAIRGNLQGQQSYPGACRRRSRRAGKAVGRAQERLRSPWKRGAQLLHSGRSGPSQQAAGSDEENRGDIQPLPGPGRQRIPCRGRQPAPDNPVRRARAGGQGESDKGGRRGDEGLHRRGRRSHGRTWHRSRETDVHALGVHPGGYGCDEAVARCLLPQRILQSRQDLP